MPVDDTAASGAAPPRPDAAPPPREPSLLAQWQALWKELPGLLNDRVELLALELQRARSVLVQALALTIVAAILGVTAWLLLWAVAVLGMVLAGLAPLAALLAALLVNAAAAAWAVARVRRLLPLVQLPATRRHLTVGKPSPAAPLDAGQALGSGS